MDSITYPAKALKIVLASLLLLTLHAPAGAAEQDVWQDVFDFQMRMAKQGNLAAQEKVAEMYEEGRGVEQDYAKARYWYGKAASQGHKDAADKLQGLPDRIRAAKAREKQAETNKQQRARQRAQQEKAARDKARQEQQAAERKRLAREKALREQRAAEKRKAAQAQAQRDRQAAERRKAIIEKARQRQTRPAKIEKSPENQRQLTVKAKPNPPVSPATKQDETQSTDKEQSQVFKADPCKSKAARFMSTCKNK